jgi:hypothetical protein
LAIEIRALEKDHRKQLSRERESARREAERKIGRELSQLEQRLQRAESEKREAIDKARREAERTAQRNVSQAVRLATRENEAKLEKLEASREKDRLRHEGERARFQAQLDNLSRKLEKQTGEQLGEEAEVDLLGQIKAAFPGDRIERVGKGVKGADIVQYILDEGKDVGRIVYESKNVLAWQNKFITQAKRYQTQYDTPHIMIVTRAFPRRMKGLCIVKGVPVVEARMAIALSRIIRDGVIEIARLRLSEGARETKAQELFDYIVSDKFRTRFAEVAESVVLLREHQQKERDWHEHSWGAESKLHDRIDARRREIEVHVKTVTKADMRPMARKAAASA